MRILFLTDGIYPFVNGGMQKHSFFLAKELAQLGCKITLAHCTYNQDAPGGEHVLDALSLNDKEITVHGYRFPQRDSLPGHYIRASKHYAKQLYSDFKHRLEEFDLVYAKGFCALYFKQLQIPLVSNIHGYEMYQASADLKSKLNAYILRSLSDKILRQSDYLASYGGKITELLLSLNIPKDRILEIPGGIQVESIQGAEKIREARKAIKFVFVGRYERRKGIEELNLAIEKLLKKRDDFEFHFVGPIPKAAQLDSAACIYHGQLKGQDSIFAVLDQCDVLVAPSHAEGMPNVILEGLARGLAIIATDVGAVSMMLDSSNGILLKKAEPLEIEAAMQNILNSDSERIRSLKQCSLKKAQSFTWQKIAEEHFKRFTEISEKFTKNFA
ncbi:MAG: glycosyltransferase family 4 protein [Luteibaculum sp.]